MIYGSHPFGAYNEDVTSGCATTVAERKAIQTVLNNLGFKDKDGKPLTVDGVWGPASKFALAVAGLTLTQQGKIKSGKDLCAYLRLGTASFKPGPAPASPVVPAKGASVAAPSAGQPAAPAPGQPVVAADASAQPQAPTEEGMSRNVKLALAFGGLALGGLLLGSVFLRKPVATAKANKRRLGHGTPPAKYRRTGATKPSDYAYPEGFMYPIHDAKHVRSAASRFAQHKGKLPPAVRKKVAKRINKAKKRFGIGGGPIRAN